MKNEFKITKEEKDFALETIIRHYTGKQYLDKDRLNDNKMYWEELPTSIQDKIIYHIHYTEDSIDGDYIDMRFYWWGDINTLHATFMTDKYLFNEIHVDIKKMKLTIKPRLWKSSY